MILHRETSQAEVIGHLVEQGHVDEAHRLSACQATRIIRPSRMYWPRRCRNPGCYSCWDGRLDDWWSIYTRWSADDPNAFLVALPADIARLAAPLRRSLRDLRDREARRDPAWADTGLYGVIDDRRALLRVSPWHVSPKAATAVLRRLWPDLAVCDPDGSPAPADDPRLRAALAVRRRGSEPLRIEVQPQRAKPEPIVPFVFATTSEFLRWSPIVYRDEY